MKRRSRPLRVVLVIGSARPGGAEGQLTRLACELRERGVDVRVLFSAHGGPLTERLDAAGVPWECTRRIDWPPSSTLRNVASIVRIGLRLARWQPDVVFPWLAGTVWMTLPMAAVLTRARRIAAFRGEVFDRDLRVFAHPFRFAVRHAHAVTVNAPALHAEAIRWGADPRRVVHIPNGVDVPLDRADVVADMPTAVVVANYRWYKGHDVLVEALAQVRTPLRVRLIGEGEGRMATETRAKELGIEDRVEFVEHPADVAAELRRAQFAIHPSRTEGLSNAILEELAHGLPVVATDVGGTPLLIDDGVNGLLVPAGDSGMLAEAISKMAGSSELRLAMAAAARERVEQFRWAMCTERYLRLFDDLSGPRKRRP